MQKEIFLIRHGETEYNKRGLVQGSGIDAPLNERGRQQAEAFFNTYRKHFFDKIYMSGLQRTHQTVEPFTNRLGVTAEKHDGLNEICWGKFEGKPVFTEFSQYYTGLLQRWQNGETHLAIEGGESPLDVALRQEPVLDLIFSRKEEKKILICMHGRAMRILLCRLFDLPISEMDTFLHNNTGLYHLVYKYNDASIYAARKNCLEHLQKV